MTREEYRKHVHTMVDLVMDIQELSEAIGVITTPSVEVQDKKTVTWLFENEELKYYTFRQKLEKWDAKPEEIIEALTKLKAELDKKKSSASDQTKTELN